MIDALVTGRSVPALLAALDLAEVGLRVAVAADTRQGEPPAAPIPDPDGVVRAFLHRVAAPLPGASGEPVAGALPSVSAVAAPLLRDRTGAWAAQSTPQVLGIPASPLASENLRLLGVAAAVRAYSDRVRPLLTVGKTRDFGHLVRKRLGPAALALLVEPQIIERFGAPADEVEVAVAAPGLNEALSRVGSLTAAALAYSERNVARETRVAPAGGGAALKAELLRKLALFGVEVLDGEIIETTAAGSSGPAQGGAEASWRVTLDDGQTREARALVLDFGRVAQPSVVAEALAPELVPRRIRVHAEIDIRTPEAVPRGSSALARIPGWSVRIEVDADGAARATLASDALPADAAAELTRAPEQAIIAALAAVDLAPRDDAPLRWGIGAAPFTRQALRAEAGDAITEVEARYGGSLLIVGRSLHGDDLAAALTAAHEGAVALRRHLTGIAE